MSLPESTDLPELRAHPEVASGGCDVRPHLYNAMVLLLQAHEYASELRQDIWDFAVELQVLRAAGITNSDLRWLVGKGFAEHAIETTGPDDHTRRFRRTPLLTFADSTCVVLTPSGLGAAHELCASDVTLSGTGRTGISICSVPASDPRLSRPTWDDQRRQLRFGKEIVKEFKLPSPNQEIVLAALEEEGWPPRIDDPLPPVQQIDSRRRLHDTIRALNRKQKIDLIRFMGDGSGEGIRWEPIVRTASGLSRHLPAEELA